MGSLARRHGVGVGPPSVVFQSTNHVVVVHKVLLSTPGKAQHGNVTRSRRVSKWSSGIVNHVPQTLRRSFVLHVKLIVCAPNISRRSTVMLMSTWGFGTAAFPPTCRCVPEPSSSPPSPPSPSPWHISVMDFRICASRVSVFPASARVLP